MRSLFVTYDGLLSPLGQSQVLPYLRGLKARGHSITILSFEQGKNATASAQAELRAQLAREGISWTALLYHKSPSAPATAFDVAQGAAMARWLIARHDIQILHTRSYVPTLMALLVQGRRKLIFDIRGLWADERVDGGIWKREQPVPATLYKLAKGLERWGFRKADHIVVLTQAVARILSQIPGVRLPLAPISVIPTCVDLERFRPAADKAELRRTLGLPVGPIAVYQGSIGTWYMLEEMVAFVKRAKQRQPDLLWLVLAPSEHERIRQACEAGGLLEGRDFRIKGLRHDEMPNWLAAADFALFFIRATYSKIASCPTKFGECLACGLPVVANPRVGDVAETLTKHRVGTAISAFDEASYDRALDEIDLLLQDAEIAQRCRGTAEADFSLDRAVERYHAIYESLA